MITEFAKKACGVIERRRIADGGFANKPGGAFRADVTCWAILALMAGNVRGRALERARQFLASVQQEDGRVCIAPQHRQAFWPTPLAILAWHGAGAYKDQEAKAAKFLLGFEQVRLVDDPGARAIMGHDPTIRGWPWIAGTSPWLEPTAYCLMALRLAGFERHRRTQEGRRLVLDRQLSAGGWNVGNTTIYGHELRPVVETTGVALEAVAGLVTREEVGKSIAYLRGQLPHLATPFCLAWAILGLSAWGEGVDRDDCISEVVERWDDDDAWDTVSLSLLVLASQCRNGLLAWLGQAREEA